MRPWTNFVMKIPAKIPKFGNMAGWHLKPRSFHSTTTQDIMIDTFKFTSKSKIWNNFCAGYSIRKISPHLSPDLYSGRAKGQAWGSCWRSLTTNFDRQLLHKKEPKCGINARIDLFTNEFHRWCSRMCAGDFELIFQHNGEVWSKTRRSGESGHDTCQNME